MKNKNQIEQETTNPTDLDSLLNTNPSTGLTTEQVQERAKLYGTNRLPERKPKNPFLIFLSQFKDLLIVLLLVATIISFVVAIIEGYQLNWDFANHTSLVVSFVQPFIILFVVILNSLLGTIQEIKSEQSVKALRAMSASTSKVLRNGKLESIASTDIVLGDIILVESGDKISADAKLINSQNLRVIEASLTGESLPVEKNASAIVSKDAPLADQANRIFSGCAVVNGTAQGVVYAIGKNSQIGQVAKLISDEVATLTPLQLKLNKLSKIFGYVGIALFIISFIAQVGLLGGFADRANDQAVWVTSLVMGISLAVAAIPEGLSAFTTIILAIGIWSMTKENALIKKLPAVETLGSTAVICSDKTGTLTQNKMTIVGLWTPQDSEGIEVLKQSHEKLLKYGILCTEGSVNVVDNKEEHVGDPTETAIIAHGLKNDYLKDALMMHSPRINSIPFDSDRKMMSVINKIGNQEILIVKGAPDILLSRCNNVDEKTITAVIKGYAKQAYRTLAVAYKVVTDTSTTAALDHKDYENNLTFIGLLAMIDPPRVESANAIEECKSAGIKPVMITGDHIDTASAIAKQIGILNHGELAITGAQLAEISDQDLNANIANYSVYARVSPADKIRIVKAWQSNHQVVAMTGDGVNDAPALKASDIGCAMGITGTDVSKEAADMILMDDNFNTIVTAVSSGRRIYQTIRRVIQNLLVTSVAEILVVLIGIFVFNTIYRDFNNDSFVVFSAVQLLWINLLTHGFPAIALGIQKSKNDVMNVRPFSKYESIFARRMGIDLIWQGALVGFLGLLAYSLGMNYGIEVTNFLAVKNQPGITLDEISELQRQINQFGSTPGFLVIGIAASIHSLNLMSEKSIFVCSPKYFKLVYIAITFSFVMILIVVLIPPLSEVFNMTPRIYEGNNPVLFGYGIGFAFIPTAIMEIYKFVNNVLLKTKLAHQKITKFEMIQKPVPFWRKKDKPLSQTQI
ncbi:cation-translocating P-type ATPase [[Mycoplasma] testudinis]|uniref:cation-translocating P-type ATPase n=1 Tax=[Mycoplasma] testudinis TaxID=33924 RepID=UPI0006970973|nr:cation-translocating P-type ATPase [[Mycoplasma] testudinis]